MLSSNGAIACRKRGILMKHRLLRPFPSRFGYGMPRQGKMASMASTPNPLFAESLINPLNRAQLRPSSPPLANRAIEQAKMAATPKVSTGPMAHGIHSPARSFKAQGVKKMAPEIASEAILIRLEPIPLSVFR